MLRIGEQENNKSVGETPFVYLEKGVKKPQDPKKKPVVTTKKKKKK